MTDKKRQNQGESVDLFDLVDQWVCLCVASFIRDARDLFNLARTGRRLASLLLGSKICPEAAAVWKMVDFATAVTRKPNDATWKHLERYGSEFWAPIHLCNNFGSTFRIIRESGVGTRECALFIEKLLATKFPFPLKRITVSFAFPPDFYGSFGAGGLAAVSRDNVLVSVTEGVKSLTNTICIGEYSKTAQHDWKRVPELVLELCHEATECLRYDDVNFIAYVRSSNVERVVVRFHPTPKLKRLPKFVSLHGDLDSLKDLVLENFDPSCKTAVVPMSGIHRTDVKITHKAN